METKDIVVALFGAAVGLAGILLVFVSFVYSRAESSDLARLRGKYRHIAKFGMVPFLVSLACAALCLRWMLIPSPVTFCWVRYSFYVCLGLTALYGVVALVFYV